MGARSSNRSRPRRCRRACHRTSSRGGRTSAAAEQQLVSANAQIGVAKALLYPQITISGFAGAGGATINGSNFGPFGIFSALPAITLPIFNMGRLQANVEYNEALAQEAGLRYQQTLQQAFREVSDALVDIRKRQEFRQQQELLVKALADASQVANLRYAGGVSSYLEVLDTERQLFDAELQLVLAKRDESVSVIQLYKALGGGWQAESPNVAAAGGQRFSRCLRRNERSYASRRPQEPRISAARSDGLRCTR